jgi:nucleoid-associated protein YejK
MTVKMEYDSKNKCYKIFSDSDEFDNVLRTVTYEKEHAINTFKQEIIKIEKENE